jgi:two-component system LytT family sensor kinase
VALWIGAWTLLGLFFSTQSYLYDSAAGQPYGFEAAVKWTLPIWYSWGLLTPLIIWYDARLDPGIGLKRRIALHIPFAILWTLVYMAVRTAWQRIWVGPYISLSFSGIAMQFHYGFLNYFLFGGLWVAYRLYRENREREIQASRLEASLAEARLESLRGQLHPHFLFNALNTVSAFVERDPRQARRMLDHVSTLLRRLLDEPNRQLTPLEDELAMLDLYLAIQRARFGDRLDVEVDVDPEIRRALVPTLLLQPLVENALRHGISRSGGRGLVRIAAWREHGRVRFEIADNGPGIATPGVLRGGSNGTGIGIANTSERLQALFGDDQSLSLSNAPAGGAVVEVAIPYRPVEED